MTVVDAVVAILLARLHDGAGEVQVANAARWPVRQNLEPQRACALFCAVPDG